MMFGSGFSGMGMGSGALTVLTFPVLGPTVLAGMVAGNMMTCTTPRPMMVNIEITT